MTLSGMLDWIGESLRGLSDRDRRALSLGGLIVIPIVGWFAFVQPYLRTVEHWNDRLASERGLLEREQALLDAAPRMGGLIKATRADVRQWDERVLRAPNTALAEAEVTALLESTARRNRVLLQEVGATAVPGGGSEPAGLHRIRMSVRGESDFEGVLGFLGALEQNSLLFGIIGVSFDRVATAQGGVTDRSGGGPQPGTMTFVAIVEAFARLDP
ncbi:MAG TPA: type II secretion system protein GspM [Longimicrobiaceae bacterium]|nr:type II secretion system protein GspM [Longimicrobiaceae bacterium]